MHCHAGCSIERVLTAMGLSHQDLLPPTVQRRTAGVPAPRVTARYPYQDEQGNVLFEVERLQPKGFRQRTPHGAGEWRYTLKGARRVLYRLPEIVAADPAEWVYVVEGEKDADRLHHLGLVATTNPMGAGKWRQEYAESLRGRRVAVIPDNDETGRAHAVRIRTSLQGIASLVRVVKLPDVPSKGDVSDFLDAGRSIADLVALVESAPDFGRVAKAPRMTVRFDQVRPKAVQWLWSDLIPLGKVTLIVGAPDVGKSILTTYLAARVSRGEAMPGETTATREPADALILNAEDELQDTVFPRAMAAGGDQSRLVSIRLLDSAGDDPPPQISLSDIDTLETVIAELDDCRYMVIDPFAAFLDGANENSNENVRAILMGLGRLAARHGIAIVIVTHMRKCGDGGALQRVLGSTGLVAAARSVLLVAKDPDDDDRRLLLRLKGNLAKAVDGFVYRIEGDPPRAVFTGERTTLSPDEVLRPAAGERGSPRLDEASNWLRDRLTNGPIPAQALETAAREVGIRPKTLRRAAEALRVEKNKAAYQGQWLWRLPIPPKAPSLFKDDRGVA